MEVAVFRRPLCMVSRAWYPAHVECCVSVSRTAQLRRSLLLFIDALLQILVARQKISIPVQQVQPVWQEQPAPETPMPEAPLVRVLETFDLSSTNVEHFLDSKADLKALVPNSVTGTMQEHI